jgi:drug/metabolite transporter (DMT)-like permease
MRSDPASILRIGVAFAVLYSVWGSTYLAIAAVVTDVPPLLMAGARFGIAGALLYGLARFRGAPRPEPHMWRNAVVLGSLFFLAGNGSVSWAEAMGLPTSAAALLVATVPLWILGFSRAAHPARGRQIIGIVLGFAGTALLVAGPEATGVDPWLAAVVLVGAACWGLGSTLAPRLRRPDDGALAAAMQMLAGGAATIVVSQVIGEPIPAASSVSTPALLAFAYLVVFGSIIAFQCYVFLLDKVPATRVATYAYVNPVVATVLGVAVGERFGLRSGIAMALVVAAVAITLSSRAASPPRARRRRSPPP